MDNTINISNLEEKFIQDLLRNATVICDYFNGLGILNHHLIKFKFYPEYKIIKYFLLYSTNNNNRNIESDEEFIIDSIAYSSVTYYIRDSKRLCSGRGVNSNVPGSSFGSFLLHLHLLLAKKCNIDHFFLDNFTNDPLRASRGIYELFFIKNRNTNNCYNSRIKITKKNTRSTIKKARNNLSNYNGEMCLSFKLLQYSDILQKIKYDIRKTNNNILWNMNVVRSRLTPTIFKDNNNTKKNRKNKRKRS